jgi:hypothetical protein
MENVKNPLVPIKNKFPKDGCQVVDVDLIPPQPLHTYCNNRFALQIYIHSQFYTDFKHTSI